MLSSNQRNIEDERHAARYGTHARYVTYQAAKNSTKNSSNVEQRR